MLKLGDKIYKYLTFNGFGTYQVIGVKEVKSGFLFEVECSACDHGSTKCTMYVVEKDKGRFNFLMMTNDDEETRSEYRCWHDDDVFYSDLSEGRIAKYKTAIADKDKEIEKHRLIGNNLKEDRELLRQHLANLQSSPSNP